MYCIKWYDVGGHRFKRRSHSLILICYDGKWLNRYVSLSSRQTFFFFHTRTIIDCFVDHICPPFQCIYRIYTMANKWKYRYRINQLNTFNVIGDLWTNRRLMAKKKWFAGGHWLIVTGRRRRRWRQGWWWWWWSINLSVFTVGRPRLFSWHDIFVSAD